MLEGNHLTEFVKLLIEIGDSDAELGQYSVFIKNLILKLFGMTLQDSFFKAFMQFMMFILVKLTNGTLAIKVLDGVSLLFLSILLV